MKDQLIINPGASKGKGYDDFKRENVGDKALGLKSLPSFWTPPFLVLTTQAHKLWKLDRNRDMLSQILNVNQIKKEWGLINHISHLPSEKTSMFIVRSSAPGETLLERGQFESKHCKGTPEETINTVISIWENTEKVIRTCEKPINKEIALVIQQYITPLASGHLSNERRVSRRITDWMCEFDHPYRKKKPIIRFKVKNTNNSIQDVSLLCKTDKELYKKIQTVASFSIRLKKRIHYEWVWDGKKLWIVQKDIEEDYIGSSPKNRGSAQTKKVKEPLLTVFVKEPNASNVWRKIVNVRTFRKCGLPVAKLFVLEDSKTIKQLIKGKITENLRKDLTELIRLPIVIRTDIKKSTDYQSLLLDRTDCVHNIDDATNFMIKVAKKLQKSGLGPNDFCFITHRFIHSRSSVYSLSWPNNKRVRIDSIWGLPDGLLYYSHDSYEVDTLKPHKIKRHIRCKTVFQDVDKEGKWLERRSGRPWDWKASLDPAECLEIARSSCKVSNYLKCPVQIMYFIDVDPSSGHPSLLPWYYLTEDLPPHPKESTEMRLAGKRFIISSEESLSNLEEKLKQNSIPHKASIWLRPKPELLRETGFIEKVAQVANSNNLPVELEGSILSHGYYILSRNNVKIKCIDVFEPKMVKHRFGKLVRDLIPVQIKSKGEAVKYYKLTKKQLFPLLKAKAIEEALELYWEPDSSNSFEELADLLEVIQSICRLFGREFEEVRSLAEIKRKERGGFDEGYILVETREVPLFERTKQLNLLNMDGKMELSEMSGLDTKKTREPRIKNKNIIVPLIPPYPTKLNGEIIIPLPKFGLETVINYTPKEVIINIRRIIESDQRLILDDMD